jgi:hypothetical protein
MFYERSTPEAERQVIDQSSKDGPRLLTLASCKLPANICVAMIHMHASIYLFDFPNQRLLISLLQSMHLFHNLAYTQNEIRMLGDVSHIPRLRRARNR